MDILDEEEFYDLMQTYRHAERASQGWVVEAYEDVKKFIRDHVDQITPVIEEGK